MSKISQELKVLLYLNQRYSRTRWVTIKEIAEYLEISDRQARRYLDDLNSITNVEIKTKLGREGGYRLTTPLDKGFAMPENIVLAMSIAMKRNKRIEEVMSTLPNYVVTDSVEGDNALDNELLDKLEVVLEAAQYQKQLFFSYGEKDNKYLVNPYKILFTNHTYYLVALSDNVIKTFDINAINENLKRLGAFKPDPKASNEIERRLKNYGIGTKDGSEAVLAVKCKDKKTLLTFHKYFEEKGTINEKELTYTVVGNSEHELYYPLFRISTKTYEFIDNDFKNRYIKYLEKQIRSLSNGKIQ